MKPNTVLTLSPQNCPDRQFNEVLKCIGWLLMSVSENPATPSAPSVIHQHPVMLITNLEAAGVPSDLQSSDSTCYSPLSVHESMG